jgi:oxygen-independent coproporphyrinogen-3 oxidase
VADFIAQPTAYSAQGECTGEDFLMLQLRLTNGLSLSRLQNEWNITLTAPQRHFIQTLCQNKLARFDGDILSLTPQGMLVQNQILCQLL